MILKYALSLATATLLTLGVARAEDAPAAAAPSQAAPAAGQAAPKKFDTGMIPSPHIMLPSGKIVGEVVLISDAAGWGDKEQTIAKNLNSQGAVVIGIDYPSFLNAINTYNVADNDGCVYTVSDIESLSQQIQRSVADSTYELPIIAGVGAGGTMALAIAAQTPDATVAQTLAVDPAAGMPLKQDLCTPAEKKKVGDNVVLGLMDGSLPNPIIATFTANAPKDGRDHVVAIQQDHPEIEIRDSSDDATTTLNDTLTELVKSFSTEKSPLGLPLSVMDTKPTQDTLAIIYSGDGGWRDIDKEVGSDLQDQGIPVVGVDSLHYFWSERKPQETADDLGRIIDYYTKHYKVQHVVLIGYSFGADVIPASYNMLKPKQRSQVVQMSLLSLSRKVDYVISVMGWLGATSAGKGGDPIKDLKSINPKIVQCVYGTDDDEDVACPDLKGTGAEIVAMAGGHHFDDDYETLSKKIIDGVKSRLGE